MDNLKLLTFIINLIRFHCEFKNNDFIEECKKIIDYFYQNNKYDLASYVSVLINAEKNVFIPMDDE